MTRFYLSFFMLLAFWAGPASATYVLAEGASGGGSEDRITALRGEAEVLIHKSQEHVAVREGEELVVRTGGKTEIEASPEQKQWQAGLVKISDSVQLNELPSLIQGLRQSQGDTFGALQSQFANLSKAGAVTAEEQQTFLKSVERLTSSVLDDQAILSSLQLKVENALATASPAMLAQLTADLKIIADERAVLQSFQSDAAKMGRAQLSIGPAVSPTIEAAQDEVSNTAADVNGLLKEVENNPAGLSQDFFLKGQGKLNDCLKELGELQVSVQAALNQNPADKAAQSLLKQIGGYFAQIGRMLKDFSVVRINGSVMTEIQDLNDSLGRDVKYLRETVAGLKAASLTREQLDSLFARYDEMMARYADGQKLYASVERSAGGQKYRTAEQLDLESLWEQVSETFQKLGAAGDSLGSPDRDKLWAAYLKPAPLALINDITAETLQGQPIVAKYLPVTPPAAHDDVSALLSGKLLGDVIVKDGITYGVTLHIEGPTKLPGIDDANSVKQATLEVFRIENGQYIATTVGTTFEVYADVPHAALSIDGSGVLSVFLNNTLGDRNMQGVLYKMDTATLTTAGNPHNFTFNGDQGWYPFIDEDGKVQNLYIDGSGVLAVCADNAPCAASLIPALDFVRWTDALKAAHSNFTFNTAATPAELPSDVVAKRLTGETGVTALGNYDYMSWGKWNDGAGVADTIYTNSSWIAGSLTPAGNIPAVGSASYKGQVVGKLSESGAISNIGGTTALTANFYGHSLTGTFDMTKNNAAWKTANVNAAWGVGTGNIAGTLTTTGMSGAVNGNFFGPSANHVGGAWNLSNGANDKAAGVFTGNKQ